MVNTARRLSAIPAASLSLRERAHVQKPGRKVMGKIAGAAPGSSDVAVTPIQDQPSAKCKAKAG